MVLHYSTTLSNSYKYSYAMHILGDEQPKMGKLNKFLTEHCELWRSIGYKLDLEDSVLNMIQRDHPAEQRKCFRLVLQKWLEQDVRPTWNTLELAITNARREELSLEPLMESKISHLHLPTDTVTTKLFIYTIKLFLRGKFS